MEIYDTLSKKIDNRIINVFSVSLLYTPKCAEMNAQEVPQNNTSPRSVYHNPILATSSKTKTPLSRSLGHGLEVDLVTTSRDSGLLHTLAEEVQVGEELAGFGVDGAP